MIIRVVMVVVSAIEVVASVMEFLVAVTINGVQAAVFITFGRDSGESVIAVKTTILVNLRTEALFGIEVEVVCLATLAVTV